MRKRVAIASFGLLATVVVTPFFAQSVGGRTAANVDVSIGGSNGVNADAGASLGAGANADVDASVGGSDGATASASASVGGGQGINANIKSGSGQRNGTNAAAVLALGGGNGANAAVTASAGGNDGSGAVVDDGFSDAGIFALETVTGPAGGVAGPAANDGTGAPGSASIAAFNAMPADERRMVIKRCRDVVNGGYDSGLVSLCRLLQASASR